VNHEFLVGFTYGFFGFLTFWLCCKGFRNFWQNFVHRMARMQNDLDMLLRDVRDLQQEFKWLKEKA